MTAFTSRLPLPPPKEPEQKPEVKGRAYPPFRTSRDLIAAARPAQWPKNLLLFAAPAATGVLTQPAVAIHALVAALAFTLASVATYYLNDLRDMAADRSHPLKRRRPFASGRITARTGYALTIVLAVASLLTAMSLGWMVLGGICAYLALTTTYSLYLKRFPVVDILAVAMGFVLRAGTGALAAGVAVTSWFLLVTFFGALYIVTAKRQAELQAQVPDTRVVPGNRLPLGASRATLIFYTKGWLEQTLTLSLTSAIICYSLWAVQHPGTPVASALIQASIIPFVGTLLRYGYLCSRGDGQRPEHLMFSDGVLAVTAVAWLAPAIAGIYMSVTP